MLKSCFTLLILVLIASCSDKLEQSNKGFLNQYGDNVRDIHSRREGFLNDSSGISKANSWNDPGDDIGVSGSKKWRSALIDTSKITLPPPPEQFMPDMETLLRDRNNVKLPNDIFEVSYNLENYPDSYSEEGISFDDIRVPKYDSFGVATDLGDKEYILAGQIALQKNVDYLNNISDKDDKQISKILVSERKELKRKKISKLVKIKKDKVSNVKKDVPGANSDHSSNNVSQQNQESPRKVIKLR